MKTKYDTARDLLLETEILPAELQLTRMSLNMFFIIVQQTRNRSNKHFRFLENVPIIANKRTHNLFLEHNVSQNGVMLQLFVTLFENGTHFQLQLEKKRRRPNLNKTVTAEMLKRHERVPTDRRVSGFKHIFH